MASSSNTSPKKIARQSSLLGTIKNIVAAPLTWLASTDRDGSADSTGKRRRNLEPVSEPDNADNGGDLSRKRMRLTSPPKSGLAAYLDPPTSAFLNHRPKRRTPAPVARSSSASAYSLDSTRNKRSSFSRSTLSPIRLGRTMSIDPPLSQLHISRDASVPDVVMGGSQGSSFYRENSLPANALTSRPSFRMRTSLTPQPQREVSEPPPLSNLVLNPTFIRPPPQQHQEPQATAATTLGSLVDTVRSARSPVRQHSSLLFGTGQHQQEALTHPPLEVQQPAPAQRALYELDIYKTPLIPTRLRSLNRPSGSNASDIPSMFKPRRSSQLVLMDDDRRHDKGKKGRSSKQHRADTKPYAGAGGMKKLLARRKQEVEESSDKETETREEPSAPSTSSKEPDWFEVASAGNPLPSGSSVRVGRVRGTRNHIERPSARPRHNKFSAVFEEEDDLMDPAEEARRKELEEAAKKLPVFDIPAGFTFAKPEATPLQQDLTNAKEPPIATLPFSFAKPSQSAEPPKAESSKAHKENADGAGPSTEKTPDSSAPPFRSLADAPPLPSDSTSQFTSAPPSSSSNVPNFFAKSAFTSQSPSIPSTPPLSLPSATTASSSSFSFPKPSGTDKAELPSSSSLPFNLSAPVSVPTNDKENPFWEGGDAGKAKPPAIKVTAPEPLPSLFGTSSTSQGTPFSFGGSDAKTNSSVEPPKPLSGAPASVPTFFGTAPQQNTTSSNELPNKDTPTSSLFGGPAATSTSFFGGSAKAEPSSAPAPASSGFSFGPPSAAATDTPKSLFGVAAPVEAPKPTFPSATSTPFSFGGPAKDSTPKPSTSFPFGGAPSTPPTNPSSTPFAFKADSAASSAATSAPFSFGPAGSSTVAPKPFAFGSPAPSNPIDRPVTPPKNNDQEFRMEESPTREIQSNGAPKPTLNFSFGGSSLFGAPPSQETASPAASSPFSFGAGTAPNPFAAAPKAEESRPFGFGSATNTPTTVAAPFSFGPSTSTGGEAPRPNTTGSAFGFGSASTPTTTAPAFSFGNNAPNPFAPGQASAPASPSTFNQSPFSFNAPLPAPANPFSFNSQPASPAGSNSGLPSTGGFGSTNGTFGAGAPSSPFSPPSQLAPSTSSGGTLFTIGAAPTPAPNAPRQIRKLPSRKPGAAKR
ncbi:hypothetical protein FA15DRAFT_668907 [Coprinopsis marcescibilis]|uniref:Uncharacterized protein n=1 Tax=Coprinopsis marcescibilis TaxID=230819 RepID=A0A5C3KXA6_COPMA|nr:hypothetical protein FA15DRAFT_668907 [Coprinopsis marcescibilis]